MTDLLFDVPWWIPTLLGVAGLAMWVSGNRRQNDKGRNTGMALIMLAVGWSVMSYLVDTPKETCQKQTRQFVQSVIEHNWSTFDRLLDPAVTFDMPGTDRNVVGRDALDQRIKPEIQRVGVKTAHVSDMKTAQSGDTIRISMTVWSTQEITMEQLIDSDWEFGWQRSNDRWLLHDIRCLRISNVTQEQARGSLRVNR